MRFFEQEDVLPFAPHGHPHDLHTAIHDLLYRAERAYDAYSNPRQKATIQTYERLYIIIFERIIPENKREHEAIRLLEAHQHQSKTTFINALYTRIHELYAFLEHHTEHPSIGQNLMDDFDGAMLI